LVVCGIPRVRLLINPGTQIQNFKRDLFLAVIKLFFYDKVCLRALPFSARNSVFTKSKALCKLEIHNFCYSPNIIKSCLCAYLIKHYSVKVFGEVDAEIHVSALVGDEVVSCPGRFTFRERAPCTH
jgi:hypothetical protein